MSVSFNATGSRRTLFAAPTDTNAVTVYTMPTGQNGTVTLEKVVICSGATGANATVAIRRASVDYPLVSTTAITANTTEEYDFGNPVLNAGDSIKVTASAGNILTFTVTIAESFRPT